MCAVGIVISSRCRFRGGSEELGWILNQRDLWDCAGWDRLRGTSYVRQRKNMLGCIHSELRVKQLWGFGNQLQHSTIVLLRLSRTSRTNQGPSASHEPSLLSINLNHPQQHHFTVTMCDSTTPKAQVPCRMVIGSIPGTDRVEPRSTYGHARGLAHSGKWCPTFNTPGQGVLLWPTDLDVVFI